MKDSTRAYWLEFNRPLEGRVDYMYLDVKGLVSTGVGNLIDATRAPLTAPTDAERAQSHAIAEGLDWHDSDGSSATAEVVDGAWDTVKARMDLASHGGGAFRDLTTLRLTDDEIDRVVFAKLDEMESVLKGRTPFADYDNWPADAQLGLLSMAWGMGPAFDFPRFQGFVAAGDWDSAADECRFNPEVGTIVLRNDRDQQLFRNAAAVLAGGYDPEVLVFPATEPSGTRPTDPQPEPSSDQGI